MPHALRVGLASETLIRFGWLRLRATGGSMLPAIIPGDVLAFRRVADAAPEPGQVVLARRDGRLVAHRLLARTPEGWLTRGDALRGPDPLVANDDLLGVLVGQHRGDRILAPGGASHRLRMTRWLLRRTPLAHRALMRWPRLAALAA